MRIAAAVRTLMTAAALSVTAAPAGFAGPDTITPGDRVQGDWFATRSPVYAQNGVAAAAHPLASEIAVDILKAGGSAVDAAIAANAALGLMEPTGNGIGGDLFAIVWDPKTEKLYGLNANGASPMGLTRERLLEELGERETIPPFGPLPVSVPGAVSGWQALHDKFGALPMTDVLQPAIDYAETGFPVPDVIAYYWSRSQAAYERRFEDGMLTEVENARATYWADGAPKAGEVFKNPDLAKTYRLIAEGGADAFYSGPIADVIDAYMRRVGGYLRKEDLAAHQAEWVEPVSVTYRGHEVWQLPPMGQGIAALQILGILEGFDLAAHPFGSPESLHLQVEAKRLAFEDRAQYYADPNFSDVPVQGLISPDYAAERRALIDPERAMESVTFGDPAILEDGDTTYLTVADKNGMMVSLIQSNYRGMGSGLVPDGLGFMLQNRGEMFKLDPDHANTYAPGKRSFHTIIPAFVTKDGQPVMSFGLMGGGMQPQGHAQIMINMLDYGMNVQEAGDAARWRHAGSTQPDGDSVPPAGAGSIRLESGYSAETRAALEAMGHVVETGDGGFGGYQAIYRDPETGVYAAASEMRKDGAAIGY